MAPKDDELDTSVDTQDTEVTEDEDYDLDSTGLEDPAPVQQDAADNAGDDAPKGNANPALGAFYEKLVGTEADPESGAIPLSLRSHLFEQTIKPELDRWQQGVDQQFEKYAPYRSFVDNGVPAEYIEAAVTLTQGIQQDPQQALRDLADYTRQMGLDPAAVLGLAAQVQQTQDATTPKPEEEEIDLGNDITKNPQFQEMQRQLQAQQEWRQQQEQQEVTRRYQSEVDSALNGIQAQIGSRPFDRQAVVQRAIYIQGTLPPNQEVPTEKLLRAAYQEWATERNEAIKSARRAPRVGGGSSRGAAAPAEPPKPKTDEERRAMIVEMARRASEQQDD